RPEHISRLVWLAMLALFFEGLNGAYYYFATLKADLTGVESLTEHSAAIHMNTFIILMVAVWLYKGSYFKRLLLPLLSFPVLLTYIITQRRAAFISLFVALALMGLMLLKENKKLFFVTTPVVALMAVLYIGIFWNASGALALPVQAIKSVVAPDQVDLQDQLSNLYRVLENVNSHYNLRQKPLTGIGFGQKLAFVVPLPDISFFVWWEYIIHNSVIWIWIKTGIGGFLTMLLLIGMAIFQGMRVVMRLPSSDMSAIVLTAVLYVIMHFIYAYVDMSWDNQSMIYLGTMMGLISVVERVITLHVPTTKKRWPWQKEVKPVLYLRPLKYESAA
ncbi:MAG TPA: hypothetical protein PK530_16850, partial [Anaerolineales bacterium]|nr:hypothetical protein [Anaerolineales bacterium]